MTFSEDEVHALLKEIAEFRGGGDEDADEAVLAFARSIAGDDSPDDNGE